MDPKFYQEIVDYLNYEKLPDSRNTAKQQKKFKTLAKQYHLQRGLLYKHMKNGTSNLVALHYQLDTILWMLHNDPTGAHFGTRAVFEKAKTRYYWPQMYNDIKRYVEQCEQCQLGKPPTKNPEIHPIVTGEPFERVGIDFVGPLPETAEGNRYIIVAIDYFTKWPEARAVKEHNAVTTSRFIYEDIICRHGTCEYLHSDRGAEFINQTIAHLTKKFGIKHTKSTPYYPQANGQVERFNRTLVNSLRKMTDGQKDWDEFIAPTLFAYRTTPQATTKISPFMITYGREARLPIDKPTDGDFHSRIYDLIEEVPHVRTEAKKAIELGAQKMIDNYEKGKAHQFNVGQEVSYWDVPKSKQFSRKLEPKRKGPYWIEEILPNGAYRIRDRNGILKNPVNGKWLLPYYSKQSTSQPQIIIDDPIPTVYKDWVYPYLPQSSQSKF